MQCFQWNYCKATYKSYMAAVQVCSVSIGTFAVATVRIVNLGTLI